MAQDDIKPVSVLVVEGQDEVIFFGRLFKHLLIDKETFLIYEAKGISEIENQLKRITVTFSDDSKRNDKMLRYVAVVCDVDKKGIAGQFKAMSNLFSRVNKHNVKNESGATLLPIPERHKELSEIENGLQTAVYVMPGDDAHGTMLEGLCLQYLNDREKERMACIEALLKCAELKHKKEEKAKLQIALAFEEGKKDKKGPRSSVGSAAQDDIWNFDHEAFKDVKTFLQQITHDL